MPAINKKALTILLLLISISAYNQLQWQEPIFLKVDLTKEKGSMVPIWAWFGYDEPNYTYMKDGKKLLSEISAISTVPVYIRTHNMLTTGPNNNYQQNTDSVNKLLKIG